MSDENLEIDDGKCKYCQMDIAAYRAHGKCLLNHHGIKTEEDFINVTMPFGMHKGKLIKDIYSSDKSYFRWLQGTDFLKEGKVKDAIHFYMTKF